MHIGTVFAVGITSDLSSRLHDGVHTLLFNAILRYQAYYLLMDHGT